MSKHVVVLGLFFVSLAASAVETKPKHVFVKADCAGPLGSEIAASLRHELRASSGYQLATSLDDDGGYDVVIAVYITCVETTLSPTERVVSVASIFGTGTCTLGSCNVTSHESSLAATLCSGNQGSGCGRELYVSLDGFMSEGGGRAFRQLSEARKKAVGN